MEKIELLAPAGNFEALKAAVEAGADAVYLAGSHFGARAYAGNFSNDELEKAVEFAHLRNVAVHVTVNTIVSNEEFDDLEKYLQFLNKINVDAVLVQDLGVASFVRQVAPELILHSSTQMTVHSLEGVKILESLGFKRIVLARELSLTEIKNICENSSAEIEIFMHGALCVCYSGQCLMSRGQCAQPCRLPYELVDENGVELLKNAGKYLLSPKDLNTIEILPKIIGTGVNSLKIEGRMKRPEYVAIVVETYRKAIDSFYKDRGNFQVKDVENRNLAQIFNRDFTTAYLEKPQGKDMISDKRPNNRGLLIGRVVNVDNDSISIKMAEKINLGDQLEIWIKVGGRVTISVKDYEINGEICTIKTAENIRGVKVHDRVFKIFDAELTKHARKFFTSAAPIRKIPLTGRVSAKISEPFKLRLAISWSDPDDFVEAETKFIVEPAKNQPLTVDKISSQLCRTGNSIFDLHDCVYNIDDNIMVPISEINDVRRRVIKKLEDEQLAMSKIKVIHKNYHDYNLNYTENLKKINFEPYNAKNTNLIIHADTIEKLTISIKSGADEILFGGESYNHEKILPKIYQNAIEIAHNFGKKIYIATPRIVRNDEQSEIEEILKSVDKANGVYVHNVATLNLAKKLTNLPIRTDFSLITFNSETIKFLNFIGVEGVTLSPELTLEQIKILTKKSPIPVECIVHGRAELMISSYCIAGSFIGGVGEHKCNQPCKRQKFFLRDRKSEKFPIVTDQFCRMHILNSKVLSMLPHVETFKNFGVARIRIDGRAMSVDELKMVIKNYRLVMNGETIAEDDNITRGHYFRGVVKS